MTSKEIVFLTLRIFGLYIIVTNLNFFINQLSSLWQYQAQDNQLVAVLVAHFINFIPFMVGIYLWLSAERVSKYFLLKDSSSDSAVISTSIDIYRTAIIIMGIYLIVTSIPWLLSNTILYLIVARV